MTQIRRSHPANFLKFSANQESVSLHRNIEATLNVDCKPANRLNASRNFRNSVRLIELKRPSGETNRKPRNQHIGDTGAT